MTSFRGGSAAGALAGQPAGQTVRGAALEGRGQDGDQAARGEPLRPGVAGGRHARHSGHDAGGHQAEQGQSHPPAPQRGLALLEGQHSLEGQWWSTHAAHHIQ